MEDVFSAEYLEPLSFASIEDPAHWAVLNMSPQKKPMQSDGRLQAVPSTSV